MFRAKRRSLTSLGTSRVEPRESNSRPVFGRVFLFNPHPSPTLKGTRLPMGEGKKEVAMTTNTRQRLGGPA